MSSTAPTPDTAETPWQGARLDLDAYLARIGYDGPRTATRQTLFDVYRAHLTTIPFENFEIMLGRPILLDLPALQDKLVRRRRGGYCYEHVLLLAAALEALGFTPRGLHARVSLGARRPLPATHALLAVPAAEVPGGPVRTWLCDVGFGSGPLTPPELVDGAEVSTGGWWFRLERTPDPSGTDLWTLYDGGEDGRRNEDGRLDRHHFTLAPHHAVDYEVGSHYVSTHPRSPFVTRPFAQKFTAEAAYRIDGTAWSVRRPDGSVVTTEVTADDLPGILERLGIVLDTADITRLRELVEPSAQEAEGSRPGGRGPLRPAG
ncbi:arylamine N-acetyltransferase [Streptomyces sp. NPDC093225]|uniref:arylamine N-acetyltransferase family protein n=1 Tax=Streptomyces sp. NPDC093225 TaxID=3366034 RepID=UPI00381E69F6